MDSLTHAIIGATVANATSQVIAPELTPICTLIGFIAGLLPDLDYVFVYIKKPLLAWKYHRVVLHNIFVLPFLALIAVMLSCLINLLFNQFNITWLEQEYFANDQYILFYAIACLALISHLILDYITSFGSSFFYPFSKQRLALGSHFLTDPLILMIGLLGLIFNQCLLASLFVCLYIILAISLKLISAYLFKKQIQELNIKHTRIELFPKIGAPFRWLGVVEYNHYYGIAHISLFKHSKIQWVDQGKHTKSFQHFKQSELLQHFVNISKFPRFSDCTENNQSMIVIEDIQWWLHLPNRPMAFSAIMDENENLSQIKESNKLDKSPIGKSHQAIDFIDPEKIL